jgi:hypothetical protein
MNDPLTIGVLGTLSQTLYDQLFDIVVEKAQSNVKKPLVKRELKKALARTEERFKAVTTDHEIYQAVLACPLHDLPSIVEELAKFYDHPASLSLEITLNERIAEIFQHLPKDKIRENIASYLSILREELITVSPDYRNKQDVLSNIRTENNTVLIASQLKNILFLLNDFIETNRKRDEFREQLQRLQEDLRERKDLRKLLIAIDITESYCTRLKLPPKLQDRLIEARKYYELQQKNIKLPWLDIQKNLNQLKSSQHLLESLINRTLQDNKSETTSFEFVRKNLETGENEVIKSPILKFYEQVSEEHKLLACNLAEMLQRYVRPLISEFPFLSASVLEQITQSHIPDDYKDVLENDLKAANTKIDQYERKVRGL